MHIIFIIDKNIKQILIYFWINKLKIVIYSVNWIKIFNIAVGIGMLIKEVNMLKIFINYVNRYFFVNWFDF